MHFAASIEVLLAPRAPKIDDQTHERHKGILPQVPEEGTFFKHVKTCEAS